ncbi:unnamed protein product [Paramecium octaurelia]|uniref:Uncharacterized protein n=1 Tax=Paramecium octaurelia TaxID=43137 RepID=A0A8S1YPZ8_PAROT|nr:unnamed protein product [Paramecium octaurelia]
MRNTLIIVNILEQIQKYELMISAMNYLQLQDGFLSLFCLGKTTLKQYSLDFSRNTFEYDVSDQIEDKCKKKKINQMERQLIFNCILSMLEMESLANQKQSIQYFIGCGNEVLGRLAIQALFHQLYNLL